MGQHGVIARLARSKTPTPKIPQGTPSLLRGLGIPSITRLPEPLTFCHDLSKQLRATLSNVVEAKVEDSDSDVSLQRLYDTATRLEPSVIRPRLLST